MAEDRPPRPEELPQQMATLLKGLIGVMAFMDLLKPNPIFTQQEPPKS